MAVDGELARNGLEVGQCRFQVRDWMFFGSLEAGTNKALFYTLLAHCRAQGLEPEAYLIEVLKRLLHDATAEQAAALTRARIAAERRAATEEG